MASPSARRSTSRNIFTLNRYRPVFYVQDNWRVTSKLTLNLGLRDEIVTPWKERHNRLGVFDPANGGNLVPVGTPGYPEDTVTDGHYRNLGPRVGFAYSVTPSTVIRAGFGIFYAYQTYNSNPHGEERAVQRIAASSANAAGEAGFAAAVPISAGFPAAARTCFHPPARPSMSFSETYPNPSANEWNFNIQRQISSHDPLCRSPMSGRMVCIS